MKAFNYIPHVVIGAAFIYSTYRVMKYVGFIITTHPLPPPHN